ncbi:hypothetical protein EBU58_06735 [bacterium]|nr:hypothetical protein [bacterium]
MVGYPVRPQVLSELFSAVDENCVWGRRCGLGWLPEQRTMRRDRWGLADSKHRADGGRQKIQVTDNRAAR